jgi:hypothetical protein
MRFRILSAVLLLAVFNFHANATGIKNKKDSGHGKEAPAAPSTPDLAAADDSGVNSDNITSVTAGLTFSGTADPNITVNLFDGVTLLGSTTSAPGTGNWTIDAALTAGAHSITAVANDGVDDSPASGALAVTVDTSAPSVPSIDLAAADDTGSSNSDNITSQIAALTISGSTEANASVELFDGVASLGTVSANGAGAYTMDIALVAGSHSITAVARDVAANASAASSVLSITIDTSTPAAPSTPDLAAADDSGGSNSDNITNQTTGLTFSGTSENNATVRLYNGVTLLGTTTANGAGNWIVDLALSAGVYAITAQASDAAGNTSGSSGSLALTILTAVGTPSSPDLASADDSGSSNSDNITKTTSNLTFSGTSDANADIELFNGVSSLGTTTANGAGAWTVDINLAAGTYSITAVATDAADNASAPSTALGVTVDTSAPTVSGAFVPADNTTSAASNTTFTITFNENIAISNTSTSNDEFHVARSSNDVVAVNVDNNAAEISITGSSATITNPGSDLLLGEAYYVNIGNFVFADIAGNDYVGIADKTTWNFTTSAGAAITAGTGTACATTFGSVSDIVITETSGNNIDGVASATRTIVLSLSNADYRFNPSATVTVSATASQDISSISVLSVTASAITINVTFESGNAKNETDAITISGIEVSNGGSVSSSNIVKNASSSLAIQGITDGTTALATVSPAPVSATPTDITVEAIPPDAAIDANQTKFSTSAQSVFLNGTPAGGTFSGNGVVYNNTSGRYTFNPKTTGVDADIPITYTYTEVGKCPATRTESFEVFVSRISGLSSSYCSNATGSSMSVDNAYLTSRYGAGSYVKFAYWNADIFAVQEIPAPNTFFDPEDPIYTSSINIYGGVYLYFYPYTAANVQQPLEFGAFVSIVQAPNVSVLVPRDTYCQDGTPVAISGSPSPKASDTFSGPGVDNLSRTFDPGDVPGGLLNSTIYISYNYTDPSTGCSNSASKPVTVYSNPSTVNPTTMYLEDVFSPYPTTTAGNPPTNIACEGNFFQYYKTNSSVTYPADYIYNWYEDAALTNQLNYQSAYFYPYTTNTNTVGVTNYFITRVVNGCESPGLELLAQVFDRPEVDIEDNKSICSTEDLVLSTLNPQLTGSATSTGSYWTATYNDGTKADGAFLDGANLPITPSNASVTDAPYNQAVKFRPGTLDKKNQGVILTLNTNDPNGPCVSVSAKSSIAISASPTALAGSDAIYCADDQILLKGSVDGANGSTTISWSVNPGGGTIVDPTNYISEFIPSATQKSTGASLLFTLTTNDPDGAGPCLAATDDVNITINREALIVAAADNSFCSDESINLSATVPPGSSASSFQWSGGANAAGFSNPTGLNTTYSEDPSEIQTTVTFRITAADPDGAGPCQARFDEMSVFIKGDPTPPSVRVPDPYCANPSNPGATAALEGFGDNIRWYDNDNESVGSLRGTGNFFSSGVTTANDVIVKFFVTQTKDGCESDPARDSIIVNPAPMPTFSMSNFCLGDTTLFDGSGSTVVYNNGLSGSVVYWNWTFEPGDDANQPAGFTKDDPINTITTRGTYEKPRHLYSRTGQYNPTLTVITSDGCPASIDAKTIMGTIFGIRIGEVPEASFTYKKFCNGDVTNLFGDAGPANSEPSLSYEWDFADPTSVSNTAAVKNPSHQFTAQGNFPVQLIITTPLDCKDTVITQVPILPYVKTFPYLQDFEAANHGWVNHSAVFAPENQGLNSWQWNTPNGTIINSANSGTKAWFTRVDAIGTYYNSERSLLYGPCVDVTLLDRPLLSFDYWNNTDERNDGVYIEVAVPDVDGNLNWQVLGGLNSGIQWYDNGLILGLTEPSGSDVGQPVGQIGWSGNSIKDPAQLNGWVNARHSLDNYKTASKLQIRFVFGSNLENPDPSQTTLDGFALDDFKLSSRNRKVLVENFTSQSMQDNNDAYEGFQNTLDEEELVKIQYHTSLQEVDPINELNKADPNARVGYYGLTNSEESIPRAIIDGQTEGSFLGPIQNSLVWTDRLFKQRTLIDAPFKITVFTEATTEPGLLILSGTITALENIPASNLALYAVVVEKDVQGFVNVVRKMLPSAAGDALPPTMAKDAEIPFSFKWYVEEEEINRGNLAVVAFIQDQETKAVMQAESDLTPDFLPSTITGVEDPEFARKVQVYPNPSKDVVHVVLPYDAQQDVPVKIVDSFGRTVQENMIVRGHKSATLSTSDYAGGVYFIQLNSSSGQVRKKIMILHE